MGLMEFKPTFRVTVDGADITGLVASRLVSLTLTDQAGVESDALEVTIADHLPGMRLAIPPTGAEMRIWLGYAPVAKYMGMFVVDSIEASGPPDQLRIRAVASIHGETPSGKTALTEQRSRSWPTGTTIGGMVQTIASEHGLQPGVSAALAGVALPHIDQVDESDINLLTRIARDHDAIAKPGDGKLILAVRGESLTVSGRPMPVITLGPRDISTWSVAIKLREPAGQVVAAHRDLKLGQNVEVKIGNRKPIHRIRRRFSDFASAEKAAACEFKRRRRAGTTLRVTMPGNPDLVAEGRLVLAGVRPGADGEWLVTGVRHSLTSSGYSCSVSAEPPEGAAPDDGD